jgi:sulfatase modifying factor 1
MVRAALALAAAFLSVLSLQGQAPCAGPLGDDALKELAAGGVPAIRFRNLIASCGIESKSRDAAELETHLKTIGVPEAALSGLVPPPKAALGARWTSPIDGREMIFVEGGQAQIGTPPTELGRDPDEMAHTVAISSFWLDVSEVTNAAYRRFILGRPEWQKANIAASLHNGSYLKDWNGNDYPIGSGDRPVVGVSWPAARAYAAWAGKRLPTEVEWEFAARASTRSRYWWGETYESIRLGGLSNDAASLTLRTNQWGFRDLLGSVWEWTSTSYRPYPYAANDGRENQDASAKVVRGGSRANGENFVRSGNRSFEQTTSTSDLLGFRCAH